MKCETDSCKCLGQPFDQLTIKFDQKKNIIVWGIDSLNLLRGNCTYIVCPPFFPLVSYTKFLNFSINIHETKFFILLNNLKLLLY